MYAGKVPQFKRRWLGVSRSVFQSDCPGVFGIVSRIVAETECAAVADAYEVAKSHGGNDEHGTNREQGVSFNPRLGRILSILIQDGHVHDVNVLRCALYASTSLTERDLHHVVPTELLEMVLQLQARPVVSDAARAIQLAWALDGVRHLHMTDLPLVERMRLLKHYDEVLRLYGGSESVEPLVIKLRHAMTLQRRRLAFDQGTEESPGDEN